MKVSETLNMILNQLYKADELALRYPEALSDDLVFDLRKLISFIEEDQYAAGISEQMEQPEYRP